MVIRYVQVQRSYRRLQMKVTVTVEGKEQKWEVKPKFIKKKHDVTRRKISNRNMKTLKCEDKH